MTGVVSLGLLLGFMFLLALPIALLATANRPSEDEELNPPKQRQVIRVAQPPRVVPEKDFGAAIRAVVAEQSRVAAPEEQVARLMRPTLYYCYEFQPLHIARIIMRENHLHSLPVVDLTRRVVGIITMHDIAALQQRSSK
ncbi:MAG TPA: CBS domain-containing protein [Terrimicrobiaceae bacterium]